MNKAFPLQIAIHWLAVLLYVLASIANTWGIVFDQEKAERVAYRILVAGLLVHGAAILLWWYLVGHGPYMARYEVLSSLSWVLLVFFLFSSKVYPAVRPASILVFPTAFMLIGLGVFFTPAVKTLPPTFRGIWLVLHVTFYKIALAANVMALVFSICYLLKERKGYPWLERFPDLRATDLLAYRFVGFGFVFWAIAMLSGSIWAYQSWGRFWGWDPIENWSLITWAGFGIYLHLRRFFGWQGGRAAYLYLCCFVIAVLSAFFVPLLDSSIHAEYFR